MRKVFEPIRVKTDRHGTPARFFWRRRMFVVSRVLDRWRYCGKWWRLQSGLHRTYYRLEARPVLERDRLTEARQIEVFQEDGMWFLSYLCD